MRARIEPMAGGEDLDIPMPAMAPAYRVGAQRRAAAGGMDPATRRLAIFAGGIGAALILLVGIWSFGGHHRADVPVIEADSRPLRVKPANPGGLQIAGANDAILSGDADAKVAMAPPPEAPAPQALKAEEKPAPTVTPIPTPPPAAVAAPPAALTAIEPPKPPPHAVESESKRSGSRPGPRRHHRRQHRSRPARWCNWPPWSRRTGRKAEWKRLEHRYQDLLDGRTPTFTRTEHAGKTYWRVRTGGFPDVVDAIRFCERVKAKGGGCSVASY